MEGGSAFTGSADGCVDQLYRGVVLLDDVGCVGRACASNVCAGVWQSAEAACRGGLFAISMGNFAIVKLAPQESVELIGLCGGCCSSPGDLRRSGVEPSSVSLGLDDEAVVQGGVV